MLGNEGAFFPTGGEGRTPKRYWDAINASIEAINKSGISTKEEKEKILDGIRSRLSPQKDLGINDAVTSGELIERNRESSKHPVEHEGLYTGIKSLDDMLLGVQNKNFMVICARTGVGKTLVANYFVARFAEQGEKILYLALEENEQEVGDRWAKVVINNNINVPDEGVSFLYSDTVKIIKEDKYNIIALIATAAQLGYTMVCVDMLNNLIDTVRDEDSNVLLNRIITAAQSSNITLIMTARLRQPQNEQEKDFPSMESVYGRVDLGYIVSKCIGVTSLPSEGDGFTYLRLHVLKNRRKRIGMKMSYPKIQVSNLLEISDTGNDSTADYQLEEYDANGVNFHSRTSSRPRGDTKDISSQAF